MSEALEEMYLFGEEKMEKAIAQMKKEFGSVRTGRANPAVLDKVVVDYYGAPTPLKQMGNIQVPEARMILITVWDQSALKDVEKAILAANIGITPTNDGKCIRLIFPELTQERRKELAKQIKALSEQIKIQLRNARRDANDSLKKLKKDNIISEDEQATLEKDVDKNLTQIIEAVDKLTKEKEEEVMSV